MSIAELVSTDPCTGEAIWTGPVGGVAAAVARARAAAPVKVRWEILRNELGAQGGRSKARLSVTPLRGQSLPAQGWSLYFNCMDGIVTGPLPGNLVLEKVVGGSLFRVRPAAGFKGVPAGRTLNVDYDYPNLLIKMARAPVGPYLVFDAAPEVAYANIDFQQQLPTRPEQLKRPNGEHALVTTQDVYRRNAGADVLPASALPLLFPTPLALKTGAGRVLLARPSHTTVRAAFTGACTTSTWGW